MHAIWIKDTKDDETMLAQIFRLIECNNVEFASNSACIRSLTTIYVAISDL